MSVIDEIMLLFERRGGEAYTPDLVTRRQHAAQAATLAEEEGAAPSLVAAALLHDIGHMLQSARADLAELGINNRHEETGYRWLREHFGPEVVEPVRLHVQAKRYLCAVEDDYFSLLSPAALRRLELQGGPLRAEEIQMFERHPFHREALRLRRIDDRSKVRGLPVVPPEEYRGLLEAALVHAR